MKKINRPDSYYSIGQKFIMWIMAVFGIVAVLSLNNVDYVVSNVIFVIIGIFAFISVWLALKSNQISLGEADFDQTKEPELFWVAITLHLFVGTILILSGSINLFTVVFVKL